MADKKPQSKTPSAPLKNNPTGKSQQQQQPLKSPASPKKMESKW